jgi:hypothetical protein
MPNLNVKANTHCPVLMIRGPQTVTRTDVNLTEAELEDIANNQQQMGQLLQELSQKVTDQANNPTINLAPPAVAAPIIHVASQQTPKTFRGDGKMKVKDFFENFELIAKMNVWDEAMKIVRLPAALEGAAKSLYKTAIKSEPKLTFLQAKSRMLEVFSARNPEFEKLADLYARQQDPVLDTIASYFHEKLDLILEHNDAMEEAQQILMIKQGLCEPYRRKTMMRTYKTTAELFKDLANFEASRALPSKSRPLAAESVNTVQTVNSHASFRPQPFRFGRQTRFQPGSNSQRPSFQNNNRFQAPSTFNRGSVGGYPRNQVAQ